MTGVICRGHSMRLGSPEVTRLVSVQFRKMDLGLAILAVSFVLALPAQNSAQTTPPVSSGEQLSVPGRPVPADHSQLSEHNIEWLQTQPPQGQMEFLLGAAINHDHGATAMINKLVAGWQGK